MAGSLTGLGLVAHDRGDLTAAHDYYTRALAIEERLAPTSLAVAGSLDNLGLVAKDRGDLTAAHDYHTRALAIFERLAPTSLTVAISLNNLGGVAHNRGDLTAAHDYYTRALAIFERLAPNSLTVAASLGNLGVVANDRGDLTAAHDYYTRALAIRERLALNSLDVAGSLNNLGNVAVKRGNLTQAHDYHTRALAIYERLAPDSLTVATSLNNLGFLALKQAPDVRRGALLLFLRAVEIVEAQRGKIQSAEARALLAEQHTNKYTGLLRAHLALNDLSAAFATIERGRARSLVELLAERQIDFRADAPEDLLKRQDELERQRSITYASRRRLDPNKSDAGVRDDDQGAKLRAEIERLAREQRDLTAEIQRKSPKFAALQYPTPLDFKRAQAALDPGTLLLTYFVDDEETFLFTVTPDDRRGDGERGRRGDGETGRRGEQGNGLRLYRIKVKAKDLRELVLEFRQALAAQGAVNRRGRELYNLLVRPAQALIDQAERVLICPDEVLHALPFGALVTSPPAPLLTGEGSGQQRNRSAKQRLPSPVRRGAGGEVYFADLKPLHTIVSMTTYAELRHVKRVPVSPRPPVPASPTLLAFGDPVYAKAGDANARGLNFAPLPGTRAEVEAIAKLYGKQASARLGADASEANAKKELASFRLIHFACHGRLDPFSPLDSGLALSADANNDGLLQAWEIFQHIKLNADLVVLSACETGLGRTTKNEGIIGLTRALQYAGAKSIVMSLWSVSDESTAALMTAFYSELKKGTSKDIALQRAMATVRKDPKWAHPFYWAPFVIAGEWR